MGVLKFMFKVAAWSLVAAVCAIVFGSIFFAVAGRNAEVPDLLRIPLGTAGAAGAIGFFILWPGMLFDSLVASDLPILKRLGWFFGVLFLGPFGAVAYYFISFKPLRDPS